MERTGTYFISDLHLGARYITDARAHEARAVAFLDSIADHAAELFLLGDVLDYWFEYNAVVPRGHVRFFGKLAQLADAGVAITWLTGNHDVWLRDYLRDELGITVRYTAGEIDVQGHRFFISHGDDVTPQPLNYRFMRWCFYNKVCQRLYASIHPNITAWIARGWSTSNRVNRNVEREQADIAHNIKALDEWAAHYAAQHPAVEHFVFGHLHYPTITPLEDGRSVCHLGAWIEGGSYAYFDGSELTLHAL